ncbi:DUF7524 family protein [Halosegnis longus]|uniref:DUF7524 family protein n=1 Tax=Halosegnis longus TaxID=2216012 RepID=UPI00096A8C8C|nr:hypothetical protein [Salella cibi]
MTDRLVVQINRTGVHSLDVPETFETDDSFLVVLRNHGESTHAHLHLGDQLSTVGRIDATNHYLDGGTTRHVSVDIDAEPGTRHRGRLKVVVGHGAETRFVSVVIDAADNTVRVDPDLSTPSRSQPDTVFGGLDPLAVGAVASATLCLLLLAAALVASAANVVFAVFAVLAGLLAAGLFAIR